MVVYNLHSSIRSTVLNYKQLALQLNTDKYLKDPNSIKCWCNRCDISFLNNYYGPITTGRLNIAANEKLCQLISKLPKYPKPKQIKFQDGHEEIQTGIDQFNERIFSVNIKLKNVCFP